LTSGESALAAFQIGPPVAKKLKLWPLIAATYFMVAGGPYGLEDIVQKAGFTVTLLILVITPLIWSLPTALMVSELASALPQEGGFYAWVRRAMGPFWGFMEAWLTLTGSIFDMALYPALFLEYLGQFAPQMTDGNRAVWLGLAMIAACTIWNFFGARAVGDGSLLMAVVLLGPFAVLSVLAFFHRGNSAEAQAAVATVARPDLLGGILIAMWNYMGWDNVTTIAEEVDRPQRTYPLAMLGAVSLVTISYLLPVVAASRVGIAPEHWSTGSWVDVGRSVGGPALAAAVMLGGVVGAIGSFNALMLSLTRLPLAMARDGMLPAVFAKTTRSTGAPWVAILACAIGWAACFRLGFVSLVILDVLLTGLSILLEFVALIVLRVREPNLPRPYRVPGGMIGAVAITIPPTVLIGLTVIRNRDEQMGNYSALGVGVAAILAGVLVYVLMNAFQKRRRPADETA
jgi:amino acid transporter